MDDKQVVKIAILGAPINSTNMGCQALTYSLISLLEEVSNDLNIEFQYSVFEYEPNDDSIRYFCNKIDISPIRMKCYQLRPVWKLRTYAKHFIDNLEIIKVLKECNVAIDITAGDSFTDIYGAERFWINTKYKQLVEKFKIPLILGPQTYGPFQNDKLKMVAADVISKARAVFSRDNISATFVQNISNRNVQVMTDLAFGLPYFQEDRIVTDKLKLGINISGLLVSEHIEKTDTEFRLKTDYDEFIDRLLDYLSQKDQYDVYLIPHVEDDMVPIVKFAKKYNLSYIGMFKDPIEAKSLISTMDIFIGSRMHATIAAFTSRVLTIPIAYSRKFEGVFNLVNYDVCVDLTILDTDEAFTHTVRLIENPKLLKEKMDNSTKVGEGYRALTKALFLKELQCFKK